VRGGAPDFLQEHRGQESPIRKSTGQLVDRDRDEIVGMSPFQELNKWEDLRIDGDPFRAIARLRHTWRRKRARRAKADGCRQRCLQKRAPRNGERHGQGSIRERTVTSQQSAPPATLDPCGFDRSPAGLDCCGLVVRLGCNDPLRVSTQQDLQCANKNG
jgi:hypothetical protein